MHTLFPHGLVSEPEGIKRVSVVAHEVDPVRNGVGDLLNLGDGISGGLLMSGESGIRVADLGQLPFEPCPIAVG